MSRSKSAGSLSGKQNEEGGTSKRVSRPTQIRHAQPNNNNKDQAKEKPAAGAAGMHATTISSNQFEGRITKTNL